MPQEQACASRDLPGPIEANGEHMTSLHLTVAVPDEEPAVVALPRPLTAQMRGRLEQAIAGTRDMLRVDPCDGSGDAGAIEYASWMPHLRPSRP
jgi:hypothetical protein